MIVSDVVPSLDGSVESLMNAAARYESASPQATTILMTARGTSREYLRLAQRQGLQRVYCVEEPDRAIFDGLLQAADLVVLPDHVPRGNLLAVEALAAGTPVIATDLSGVQDIVRPEFGAIAPADDHELLADAILRALHDGWKQTKGRAAAEYACKHHDLDQYIVQVVEVYQAVFRQRYGRAPE
jgi:glycosyltransferase involved in cell wall biosynthesis